MCFNLLNLVMENNKKSTNEVKFRPDYEWPKNEAKRDCPKCHGHLELQKDSPEYFGKPWWCPVCKWQYSEEDLK